MVVIDGYGGYIPQFRIDRKAVRSQYDRSNSGSGESAVPGRDENHVTMASEAADTALDRSSVDAEDVAAVCATSITDPFAEHGIAAHVAYQLGLGESVRTGDFRSTGRAATDALSFAREFVAARGDPVLVVGVDIMPADPGGEDEAYAGAGAGAALLKAGARQSGSHLVSVGQSTTGFVERHRVHGETAVPGDESFESEFGFGVAVESAASQALPDADVDLEHAVIGVHDQRMARAAVETFPGDLSLVSTFDSVGYAGTASFFIDLAFLLETESAGEGVVAATYGAGGADVVVLKTGTGVQSDGLTVAEQIEAKEYVTYGKHLKYRERPEYTGARGI